MFANILVSLKLRSRYDDKNLSIDAQEQVPFTHRKKRR